MVETKLINLNSSNAIKNNTTLLSNVFFPFPNLINSKNVEKAYVSVLNAQFPYSYYIINIYNNVLRMSVNGGGQFSLTLTRGNYNSTTLATEIIAQLALAGVANITIALNTTTGSLSFTTTGTSIEFFASGSTILRVLGFDPSTNYVSVAKVLTAPFPLNLLNTLKIRIASLALCSDSLDSAVKGNLNVLAAFPVNAEGYGLNLYENTTGVKSQLQIRDLNGFDIQILDDDGNLINFNNVYWTITMIIEIHYKEVLLENPFKTDFTLPRQSYWGANPNMVFEEQQDQPIEDQQDQPIEEPLAETQPIEEPIEEPVEPPAYLQAEPPNYEIQDPSSLEELLTSNGIYT
jgi:hypothetical protein